MATTFSLNRSKVDSWFGQINRSNLMSLGSFGTIKPSSAGLRCVFVIRNGLITGKLSISSHMCCKCGTALKNQLKPA